MAAMTQCTKYNGQSVTVGTVRVTPLSYSNK